MTSMDRRSDRVNLPEIVRNRLLSSGADPADDFLLAVSGGADSSALLLSVHEALGAGSALRAAHLDHGVRPGSETDFERVRELCCERDIPIVRGSLEKGELESARRKTGSLEAAMRELRYRFLFDVARKSGSRWILTGHTADDQAETTLFRVLRRMDWRSFAGISGRRGMVLRPLLGVTRERTSEYCREAGYEPVVDPSNLDEAHSRGRLRNRVLPGLAISFHPDTPRLLLRMGRAVQRLSAAELDLLSGMLPEGACGDDAFARADRMAGLPTQLRERCVIQFLLSKTGSYPSHNLLDDVVSFLQGGKNGTLSLPGNRALRLSYNLLSVVPADEGNPTGLPSAGLELPVPGDLAVPGTVAVLTARETVLKRAGSYPAGDTALFSKKRLAGPLFVRRRLPGDRYTPLGMDGEKKVKDLLIDRKVPREVRDMVPILVDREGDIVWIAGLSMAGKAALEGFPGEEAVRISVKAGSGETGFFQQLVRSSA